jgi:hypothetical protein
MKITSPRYKLISAVYEPQPHFGAAAGAPGAGARASERASEKSPTGRLRYVAVLTYQLVR